jgi:hypothetical protein
MPFRARRPSKHQALNFRLSELLVLATTGFFVSNVTACGEDSKSPANNGANATGGAGGGSMGGSSPGGTSLGGSNGTGGSGGSSAGGSSSGTGGSYEIGAGIGGSGFNQCGVAAPLPKNTGQCTTVSTPTITNFDDYAGGAAASYNFHVNPNTANPVLGSVLHVGDGSDTGDAGTSVISTQMVTGDGGTGYALQISDTNATHWGGLLMFFIPSAGACLDAHSFGGVQFSIQGTSPSGRFGVNLGMLDTIPTSDNGLCSNSTSSDCKDANVEFTLPADSAAWTQIQIPWGSFTPGVGSGLSCVPVTGQNIVRLVIQPFMNYPPPNYTFQPGAYSIAVDNVKFY